MFKTFILNEPDGDYVAYAQQYTHYGTDDVYPVWYVKSQWLIPGTELED
jgi:hypothetical protein